MALPFEIDIQNQENYVILRLNPEIYPLNVIFVSLYAFLDKAYFILDGDKTKEILIKVIKKNLESDLKNICNEFYNELINYSVYHDKSIENKEYRLTLLKRALLTNGFIEDDSIDDPLGISIPWEEKYGGKNEDTTK